MRKLLALAALVLGLASCQTEPEGLDVNVGGEQEVAVCVSLPEATRAADSAEGAFKNLVGSDEYTIRYIFQVFYKDTESLAARQVIYSDGNTVSFPVRLVPGREYNFVAWADVVLQDGKTLDVLGVYNKESDYRYNTEDLTAVTFKGEWYAMDETFDAYTDAQKIEYYGTTSINLNLTRPFAKLRVMTTDMVELGNLQIVPEGVTVEYTVPVYKSFDVTAQAAKTAGASTHTFTYNLSEVQEYTATETTSTLFTNYLFGAENGVVKFTMNVNDTTPELIKFNNFNTDIPVKRNYLTTISGNILTDGNNITVTVENDGKFAGEETVEYVEVNNATEFQDAIDNAVAGEETVIVLGSDINLGDGIITLAATRSDAQCAILVPAGKTISLDLNGKTLSLRKAQTGKYALIENNGILSIYNSGKRNGVISYGDTAELTADVGYASNTIQNNGVLTINEGVELLNTSCTSVATYGYPHVIDTNGTLTINGGTLTNEANYSTMRIWTSNTDAEKCNVTINGGIFNGCIDFQAHNNNYATIPHYGTLTVKGGTFNADTFTQSSIRVLRFAVNANDMHATINGGTFNGKVWVRNIGTFAETPKIFDIYNGTFTTMYDGFDTLLAKGYAFVEGENGVYTVENTGHYTDAEGNYYITNAKGLAWVSENVNTMEYYVNQAANIFDGKTVYLVNDIDLGGAEWRPIGDYAFSRTSFNGVFDGQGYTVSNFKVTNPVQWTEKVTEASYGFFGNVKGTIKNLTIKNATVNPEGGRYSAALVGRLHNGGCIENCHVENSSVTILHWQVGGIVGQNNNGNISNCSVVGSTITGKAAVGAIVGMDMTNGEHTIENCRVANTALVQNESFGASYDASYGLAVGLVNASGIVLNIENVVAENNTIMGVADNTLVGHIETGATVTINGVSIATTAKQLAAAIEAGGECALGADIALDAPIQIQGTNFSINGNGFKIGQSRNYPADGTAIAALIHPIGGEVTIKNVVFDSIENDAAIRTADTKILLDNITVTNCNHTKDQGLLRLLGESTIKNSTFSSNNCKMVVSLNFDGNSNVTSPQVVENCEFNNNICNTTAVVYYAEGGSATIDGNKFVNNTLTVSNGATVYLGFKKNCTVTNNLFDGNTVTATSKRSSGGLMVGNAAVVTGNAFVNNTVTVNGQTGYGNNVCASPYYAPIDLSGNYWGGNAPVENDDYYKEYNNYEVIINDYLTANPFN